MDLMDWFRGFFTGMVVAVGLLMLFAAIRRDALVPTSREVNAWMGAGLLIHGVAQLMKATGMSGWSLVVSAVGVVLIFVGLGYQLRQQPDGSGGREVQGRE